MGTVQRTAGVATVVIHQQQLRLVMTPEEKEIVQSSWKMVVPIADTAADLFYDKLFELDPSLKHMFDGVDLAAQKKKLLQALATTVSSLDTLEALVPVLSELGRRHATYGVIDKHYDTVASALLWTLETGSVTPGRRRPGKPGRRPTPSSPIP